VRFLLGLVISLFCFQSLDSSQGFSHEVALGSREGDPDSLVEDVSTIRGDYSEVEVDLTVAAPDSLILSRYYTSQDGLQTLTFGAWRFLPHCFLSIRKDPQEKIYTTAEGTFEKRYVTVGTQEGSILTYVGWLNTIHPEKNTIFKIDPENETVGLANTARGTIGCWTNLKNNEISFDSETDSFELKLASEGKRFYIKNLAIGAYLLSHEILPSGNKIFYEWSEQGQITLIKETNASEKKVLAWMRFHYGDGIHVETSDDKTVDYHFQKDSSGYPLLTEVDRSHKPQLLYHYQVVDNRALLLKKILPEGRFVQVDYYMDGENRYKVRSVATPDGVGGTMATYFSYEDKSTEVCGPGSCKRRYCFNEEFQLVKIEQYLQGALYRVQKKAWGKKCVQAI